MNLFRKWLIASVSNLSERGAPWWSICSGTLPGVRRTCPLLIIFDAEEPEHMANHFQHDHCGNWKVEEFQKQLKSLRDFGTTALNQQEESANEHGPLDSDVFGFDKQDQDSTKGSSSAPRGGRQCQRCRPGQEPLSGRSRLCRRSTGMMFSRSGSTVGEENPDPDQKKKVKRTRRRTCCEEQSDVADPSDIVSLNAAAFFCWPQRFQRSPV